MTARDVLGRLQGNESNVEYVSVNWEECARRRLRKVTDRGTEVVIDLPPGPPLADGDILIRETQRTIAVRMLPADILVARPASLREMGTLCYQIGNLHQPVWVGEEEVVLPDEPQNEALLQRSHLPYAKERRLLPQGFATSRTGHTHVL